MVQAHLFLTNKRYGLPESRLDFSHVLFDPIETPHYTLSATCDRHEAIFNLVLNIDAINSDIAARKLDGAGLTWDFLGYVKNEPFTIEEIQNDKQFRRSANIRANRSGNFPQHLKSDIPYYALFMIVIENDDLRIFDSEIVTMFRVRPVPSVENIIELKAKLKLLNGFAKTAEPEKGDTDEFDVHLSEIMARYRKMKESLLQQMPDSEERIRALEGMEYNCGEEIAALVQKYKK